MCQAAHNGTILKNCEARGESGGLLLVCSLVLTTPTLSSLTSFRKPSRLNEGPSCPPLAIDMKTTPSQASILALAAWSAVLVSAGAGPSPEAKKQYAMQWQALSDECKSSLMTVVDSKSEISKCSFAGKLFNNVVSNSAVVSVRWPPAAV